MSVQCPDCKGTGQVGPVHVNYGYDPKIGGCRGEWKDKVPCLRCKAAGSVPDEMLDWMAQGKGHREQRVRNDESLMECAKRLGIKSSDLSAFEHGRIGLERFNELLAERSKP